jgi:hypothetical protein
LMLIAFLPNSLSEYFKNRIERYMRRAVIDAFQIEASPLTERGKIKQATSETDTHRIRY